MGVRRSSSRVVARGMVVGRREVVGRGKILVGRRRGVMVSREKNDFFYEPHSSKILKISDNFP